MVYHTLRALKESGTPAARARHLVMIGDNYGENKNNTDLAFCTELVQRGWYDSVKLLYGYVCDPLSYFFFTDRIQIVSNTH